MAIATMDRCSFGQHDSHEVVVCDGTKFWACSESVCRDHLEHCYVCDSDVCPACMQEHKEGDCFTPDFLSEEHDG